MSEFIWSANKTVIFQTFGAVAAYVNEAGDVFLGQRSTSGEDQIVVIPKLMVKAVISKLEDLAR